MSGEPQPSARYTGVRRPLVDAASAPRRFPGEERTWYPLPSTKLRNRANVLPMTSWRMQLHPNFPGGSTRLSAESLSAGFVGLDFGTDVGDLHRVNRKDLPKKEKNYWAFAHEMAEGDRVLIFSHHYPLALARVAGPYNYVRNPVPQIGVWFRHFRAVDEIRYYSDYKKNAANWKPLTMTATLTPLRKNDSASQQLVDEWLAAGKNEY